MCRMWSLGRAFPALSCLKRLWQEDEAQDLAEYGLLLLLVVLAAVASVQGVASTVSSIFSSTAASVTGTV